MMTKKVKGERSIIAPKGDSIVHTGKFRLPDGTIRAMPELGMTNIKTPKKMEEGGAAISDADQKKMRRLLMEMSVDEKGKSISDADKKRVKKVVKMKDGGGVVRGAGSAISGATFRGVR
mgnify:FL=1